MACCKCCCGNEDCSEGQQGKCCCGGAEGTCCSETQYCCDGACEDAPCAGSPCDDDADCATVFFDYNGEQVAGACCPDVGCKHPFTGGCCYDVDDTVIGPAADIDEDCLRLNQSYTFGPCPCPDDPP